MSEQLKHLGRVETLTAADNIAVTAIKYTFKGDLSDSPNQDAAARVHPLFPAYLQAAAQQKLPKTSPLHWPRQKKR